MPSEAQAITSLVETGMIGRIGHVNWQNRLCGLAEQVIWTGRTCYLSGLAEQVIWTSRTCYLSGLAEQVIWDDITGYMDLQNRL